MQPVLGKPRIVQLKGLRWRENTACNRQPEIGWDAKLGVSNVAGAD